MDVPLERVIDCALHDPNRRIEIWMTDAAAVLSAGQSNVPNFLPTHVRVVHGHHNNLNIRPSALFGKWQQFEFIKLNDAPKYIYHYTTPGAMSGIARANEICPGGLSDERRVRFVFCSPLHATSEFNLPGCHRKNSQSICMVLDFHLMLSDGFVAFYSADGSICVDGPIQSGYVVQVFDLQYGEAWYFRNFDVKYPRILTGMNTVNGRRAERVVKRINCTVCNGIGWMGTNICFHCTRPYFYSMHLPTFAECNPAWRGIQITAYEDIYLNLFKQSIHESRRLKSNVIYALFLVKPPPPEVLKKRLEASRGNPGTIASNFDKSQDRLMKSLNKNKGTDYVDVQDRIRRHAPYRVSLAEHLMNVDCYPNPAQYLLSKYCKYALEMARNAGEVAPVIEFPPVQLRQCMSHNILLFETCTLIQRMLRNCCCSIGGVSNICCCSIDGDVMCALLLFYRWGEHLAWALIHCMRCIG